MPRVHVTSEIGALRSVLVHTPGPELLAVTPGSREAYLYDDIVDLELAQHEHKRFVAVLRRFAPKDAAPGGAARSEADAAARSLERGQLMMDPERHTCTWKGEPVTLTVTEFLILQALAQRPGVVKSRNALMDAAYDDQVYVDDRTIDSHIKRLRKKFKVTDQSFDMIETLYGVGYRFKEG